MSQIRVPIRPLWSPQDGSVHLSYELPTRIHVTRSYPVRSGNGSSVIVYGHDQGLTVWWRGGRSIKTRPASQATDKPKQNGFTSGLDDVMIIDSDEDDPPPNVRSKTNSTPAVEFEEEDDEFNPMNPYEHVIAHTQIDLGTAVHDIAVPSLPADLAHRKRDTIPTAFSRLIVVAITCADCSTRLFTLPLSPARECTFAHVTPEETRDQHVSMSLITDAKAVHRSIPKMIAITYTAVGAPAIDLDVGRHTEEEEDEWRIWLKHHHDVQDKDNGKWDLVITSYSAEPFATLVCTRLHYNVPENFALEADPTHTITETTYLPNGLASLSFNPSRFPSHRHTRLLLSESAGVVRSCDILLKIDSRQYDDSTHNVRLDLKWLFALQVPTPQAWSATRLQGSRNCRLLGAEWTMEGHCVLVLLGDGQWGIWDLEGAGPVSRANAQRSTGFLVGGSNTQFTIRGFLGHSHDDRAGTHGLQDKSNEDKVKNAKELAPMTPNTRKARQENFFSRPVSVIAEHKLQSGGISMAKGVNPKSGRSVDESVLLWYGSGIYAIPSLMTYWQAAVINGGQSSGDSASITYYGPNTPQVAGVSTLGESITSIAQVPHKELTRYSPTLHMQHDILVSAEHRVVMLCSEQAPKPSTAGVQALFDDAESTAKASDSVRRLDNDLLSRGEMDLAGMNRLLDGMASDGARSPQSEPFAPSRPRKVGFAN